MKKSLLIGLLIAIASYNVAFANTITYRCDAATFDKEHNWGYKLKVHCCNPKVTSCSSKDAIITEAPGKISVGGNKSHHFKMQCNGSWYKVNNTSFGHSGGTIAGTALGGSDTGTTGQYTMLVHNSSSKGGHAWINGFDCE